MIQNNENTWRTEFTNALNTYLKWLFYSLLDAVFLIIWIILQSIIGQVVIRYGNGLDEFDSLILNVFRGLFAITTLVPILSHFVLLASEFWVRTKHGIRQMNVIEGGD